MADRHRDPLPTRLATVLRIVFALVGVASLVLGYIGLHEYIVGRPVPGTSHAPSDVIYFDTELFLLQSTPISQGGPFPWPLAVARFAAPCVSVYTVIEFGVVIFAGRLRSARMRRYRGHAIVCGSTRAATVLVRRLREERRRVVTIEAQPGEWGTADCVVGDAGLPRSLRDAGVERADVVYTCLDDSHRNVDIANTVEQIRAGRPTPARIHAMVRDLDLCLALKARLWSTAGSDGVHVDFFNPDELAAQRVIRRDEALFAHGPPRIAIAGTGAFGRSVLVEAARQWLVRRKQCSEPLQVVLVGPGAVTSRFQTTARYPFVEEVCDLRTHTGPVQAVLGERLRAGAPRLDRIYLCEDDEGEALKAALASVAYLRSAVGTIVVRLDRMSGMAGTFEREPGSAALFDVLGGRLHIVDVAEESCDAAVIGYDLAEGLARSGHQRYLVESLAAGAVWGGTPAMADWEDLSEDLRAANRAQAIDIGRKTAAISCLLVPRSEADQEFGFRDAEVEVLARGEHERWMAERIGRGWRHGPRDDAAKRHPDLCSWEELSESGREKDRAVVRAIPEMLAEVGLAMVRIESVDG